jgi:hypothetical protein
MRIRNVKRKNAGSALILVVVVTVLLSVVGILFVMTARIREMTTSNVTDDRDLDTGIQTLAGQIQTVLLQDLFGTNLNRPLIDGTSGNEAYDMPAADPWLGDLEPDTTTTLFQWRYVTDLANTSGTAIPRKLASTIVPEYQTGVMAGRVADADGDGVADSLWSRLPDLSTSRGKPVYAAVRIIDNCAMLNLNTAYCFYQAPYNASSPISPFGKTWYINQTARGMGISYPNGSSYADGGRYLSEINYLPFLRGSDLNAFWGAAGDGWYNILVAKKFGQVDGAGNLTSQLSIEQAHDALMSIENPGAAYRLFDIGDELEIRNRFILTSLTESRFERSDAGNFTFDAGGGSYAVLQIPRDNSGSYPILDWVVRMDPANFDLWDETGVLRPVSSPDNRFKYDRRHVCTFYSFDRNIRTGSYLRLEAALNLLPPSVSASQKLAIEGVFRPTGNRPIDLRSITDPAKLDAVTNFLISITSNTPAARKNILHLLYAFRECEFFPLRAAGMGEPEALAKSARKAAQQVANMLDYLDDSNAATRGPFYGTGYQSQRNPDPTYITKAIVDAMILEASGTNYSLVNNSSFDFGLSAGDVFYGYERQPFISEVYCNYAPTGAQGFALELLNPYTDVINLDRWRITIGSSIYDLTSTFSVPAGTSSAPGRLVIYAGTVSGIASGWQPIAGFGLGTVLAGGVLELKRPDPANAGQFITVDGIDNAQRMFLVTAPGPGNSINITSRDDKAWKFTNKTAYVNGSPGTLGLANGVNATPQGYQLPVDNANVSVDRLADFQKVAWLEPNEITTHIADVSDEANIRFDHTKTLGLQRYVCTLSREEKGIPGRININTAPVHVIAAAIPPQLVMTAGDPNATMTLAGDIVANRPYRKLGDLLNIPAMKKFANHNPAIVGDVSINGDFEKRDWIFNRLSNIFTVRSDTFTAYILVRLGTDGPQRRMLAVFDRSNCWSATDKPKIAALHLVPDPR